MSDRMQSLARLLCKELIYYLYLGWPGTFLANFQSETTVYNKL